MQINNSLSGWITRLHDGHATHVITLRIIQIQIPELQVHIGDIRGGKGMRRRHDQRRRRGRHLRGALVAGDAHPLLTRPPSFHFYAQKFTCKNNPIGFYIQDAFSCNTLYKNLYTTQTFFK